MKPIVAITAHRLEVRDGAIEFGIPHEVVATAYVRAVARAGATPVLLPIVDPDDTDSLHTILDRFDAVVITGGADVDPAAYGADIQPDCGPTQPDRDRIDLAVARACVERDRPALAICRGIQVLNVALGGTLTQHIDDHMVVEQFNEKVHGITIDSSSRLAGILDTDTYWSNSLHHQCIAEPGPAARVVARADDGTIEAIEVASAPHVLGVQWHPELLRHDDAHLRLFRSLLGA